MRRGGDWNKGEKAGRPINDLRARRREGKFRGMADASGHFMRVEREAEDGRSRHYVVHLRDPKFTVELSPDTEAADKVGIGLLKRVCIPNSWAGYGQYGALLKAAQEFFRASMLAEPVAKTETRRLKF